jgi:type IV pilus assembly protein PilP
MVPSGRIILLSIFLIIALPLGCGERTESEKPQKPPGLRKKISAPKEPIGQAAKSKGTGRIVPSKAETVVKEANGLTATDVEPSPPDKRDIVQPEKSDFLALAEGMTKRPDYFYDPKGKHDPFESLFEMETEHVGIAPSKRRVQKKRMPLTPLQRVSLSQLKLVAIVLSPTGNKALVEEPSGKGYVISKGTYIGQNYERVKEILKDRVIVEGEVEDFITGSTKLQTTELKLQKKVGDV